MRANEDVEDGDAVGAELTALLARLAQLATAPGEAVPDAARIDRIALFERVRSALAAAQHTEMVAFARSQVEAQIADDRVDPKAVGRGIGDQIGLACEVSPTAGSHRLEVARALWAELPETRALLIAGRISEVLAEKVVSETSHLGSELRRLVDKQLAGDGLDEMGCRRAVAAVRRRAYEADRAGYTARGRKARTDRRVTLRPAPDTMSLLSVFLPAEQGVACLAALRQAAQGVLGVGDEARTRDQIMTDTLVERVTGQTRAEDVNVEVNLVIPLDALADPEADATTRPGPDAGSRPDSARRAEGDGEAATGDMPRPRVPRDDELTDRELTDREPADGEPAGGESDGDAAPVGGTPAQGPRPSRATGAVAELHGYGPIPAAIARDILATTRGRLWWRRLFAAPCGGALVGGDPRRRRFDGFLAHLIGLRDHGHCRDPHCDAPIRHLDHIRQVRAGGPTSYANGRGVCARGNYVREMPGWHVETLHDGLHGTPHTVRTTTPTGHTYVSRAGPAP